MPKIFKDPMVLNTRNRIYRIWSNWYDMNWSTKCVRRPNLYILCLTAICLWSKSVSDDFNCGLEITKDIIKTNLLRERRFSCRKQVGISIS